ncbi:micronemal protein 4 isoform X2 [Magallana gigas]|uniref:micronemal protein 4 isoform X2 n=1 Tax=Magallana gigas TaxID=29159 RepID=UPI003340CF04
MDVDRNIYICCLDKYNHLTAYTGGQITTPSTSQCGVNDLDLGSGTTMDLSEFYQTYVNDPSVTSLSDCKHLCDVDSQCKAIGYMNDISGVSCGLSESDHVTATACPSCHVFTKNCSADCVTYTVFSGGYIGRTQYANYDPSSYTECQDRCTNDQFCNGFIHNDVIMTCRLSESRKEVASPGNASFSFSRKECSSGCANYLAYGVEYIIEFSALYSLNSPVTKRACEALCTADPGCRGAAYQTSDQNCGLFDSGTSQKYSGCLACTAFAKQCPTDSTVPKYLACAECSFSARDCDVDEPSKYFVQCLTNFCSVGVNLTVSMESSKHDSSDFATCQDLCANDPLCLSFHHSQGDLQCRLSTSDKSTSGCDACQLYTKYCLPGCDSVSYVRHELCYTTASVRLDLICHVTPFDTCRQLCNNNTFCLGFAYQADSSRCALSGSGTHIWYPECPSCLFSKKICLVSEPPTAIPEVIISNGTIDCVCVCKHTNQTVDEIMQQRKIQLTVDTEALSSTLI